MRAAVLAALSALLHAASFGQTNVFAKEGFRVSAGPAYEGAIRTGDGAPALVRIENLGPDSGGVLLVGAPGEMGQAVRYPVSLPRGSKKAIPVTAPSRYGGLEIYLQTDRGQFEIPLVYGSENARASVLAVGDDSGGLAFLKTLEPPKTNTPGSYGQDRTPVAVAYARPEAVPEAEASLGRTSCVALMPGSERLNARQLDALRRYVLRGGHLVLFGGASAPILTDARLAGMLPYSALTPGEVTVRGRTVAIQRPTALPGAESNALSGIPVVRRSYGAGRVSLFAADPTEGEFTNVPDRAKIVARAFDLQRSTSMTAFPLNLGPGVLANVVAPSQNLAPEGRTARVDPFALPIPPTGSILMVLGAYFLVVLPINFLVLRAFKRLELAWFTAPILAIGFAGLLFRNAGSLYNAELSRATQTAVFASSGAKEGLALGRAQLFFPGATRGPIPIERAEAIGANLYVEQQEYGYYGGPTPNSRPLNIVVTDGPSVPDYGSTALEFRDLEYRQSLDLGQGIRVTRAPGGKLRRAEIVNGSPYTLRGVRVIQGTATDLVCLGTDTAIPPGDRAVVIGAKPYNGSQLSGVLFREAPMLLATLEGAPVGPRLGSVVANRTWTRVLVSGEVTR